MFLPPSRAPKSYLLKIIYKYHADIARSSLWISRNLSFRRSRSGQNHACSNAAFAKSTNARFEEWNDEAEAALDVACISYSDLWSAYRNNFKILFTTGFGDEPEAKRRKLGKGKGGDPKGKGKGRNPNPKPNDPPAKDNKGNGDQSIEDANKEKFRLLKQEINHLKLPRTQAEIEAAQDLVCKIADSKPAKSCWGVFCPLCLQNCKRARGGKGKIGPRKIGPWIHPLNDYQSVVFLDPPFIEI